MRVMAVVLAGAVGCAAPVHPEALEIARGIPTDAPIVCSPDVSAEFRESLGRATGRSVVTEPGGEPTVYWVAGSDEPEPASGTLLLTTAAYRVWTVEHVEALSLSGIPLARPPMPEEVRASRLEKLDTARKEYEARPDDVEALIWLGRRTAYLTRYNEAVAIYTRGIEQYPDDPRLYRHRGHRYISLRRLDAAIADLEHAVRLIAGRPDEIEPDGLPNALGIPTSTLNSNIWYHLGLAYYLRAELEQAERCYRECLKFSGNPDMLSATMHWLYMTLRRAGREDDARELLEPIHEGMQIIENVHYHALLLMYKGARDPEALLADAVSEGGVAAGTVGYGVGNWYGYEGRHERSRQILDAVLRGEQWPAFGYIAAEADVRRIVERG